MQYEPDDSPPHRSVADGVIGGIKDDFKARAEAILDRELQGGREVVIPPTRVETPQYIAPYVAPPTHRFNVRTVIALLLCGFFSSLVGLSPWQFSINFSRCLIR